MYGTETMAEQVAQPVKETMPERGAVPILVSDEDGSVRILWEETHGGPAENGRSLCIAAPAPTRRENAAAMAESAGTSREIGRADELVRAGRGYLACKRLLDIAGALAGLVLLGPLMLAVGLVLWLREGRPVLFSQRRAGLGGKPFRMLKFRTMRNGAESVRDQVRALQDLPSGPCLKCRSDPRVTRLGRILRCWSIDELPQLFNVLAGQMSLVGPRPLPMYEVRTVTPAERMRLAVKPGLTCLWQVGGRNELPYEEWTALDALYAQNRSIWLDLLVLIKTIPAVVSRYGAF